jgi:hypothetical protein
MPGKLWNDVGAGKGSKRRLGSDQDKYNEGWSRIFGNKEVEEKETTEDNDDERRDETS